MKNKSKKSNVKRVEKQNFYEKYKRYIPTVAVLVLVVGILVYLAAVREDTMAGEAVKINAIKTNVVQKVNPNSNLPEPTLNAEFWVERKLINVGEGPDSMYKYAYVLKGKVQSNFFKLKDSNLDLRMGLNYYFDGTKLDGPVDGNRFLVKLKKECSETSTLCSIDPMVIGYTNTFVFPGEEYLTAGMGETFLDEAPNDFIGCYLYQKESDPYNEYLAWEYCANLLNTKGITQELCPYTIHASKDVNGKPIKVYSQGYCGNHLLQVDIFFNKDLKLIKKTVNLNGNNDFKQSINLLTGALSESKSGQTNNNPSLWAGVCQCS